MTTITAKETATGAATDFFVDLADVKVVGVEKGETVGGSIGALVGLSVGEFDVGDLEGDFFGTDLVGVVDGDFVVFSGLTVGAVVGFLVGEFDVGDVEGDVDGPDVLGIVEGDLVIVWGVVGPSVGDETLGDKEGGFVGFLDGESVGHASQHKVAIGHNIRTTGSRPSQQSPTLKSSQPGWSGAQVCA